MDAYVSKPLRVDELFSAIDALSAPRDNAAAVTPPASPGPTSSVDLAALLAGFNGDQKLVHDVADVFLQDAPDMMVRLRDAVRARNATAVAAAAHALKGSAGLFSLGPAYQSARRLEERARAADLSAADTLCADIEADVARLMAELRDLKNGLRRA